jgi:hypothetical protein
MKMPNTDNGVTVGGVVPLNHRLEELVAQGHLADLSVANVMNLLKGHLQWKIRLVSFNSNLPNLQPAQS